MNQEVSCICSPVDHRFPNSATRVITTRCAVSWARCVARIKHILCRTALLGTLRITREVTRSGARYTRGRRRRSGGGDRRCSGSKRSLRWLRTAVVIAIRETTIVACSRTWRNFGGRNSWGLTRRGVESAASGSASWRVACVWLGTGLCANSNATWLIELAWSKVTRWKSNWKQKKPVQLKSFLYIAKGTWSCLNWSLLGALSMRPNISENVWVYLAKWSWSSWTMILEQSRPIGLFFHACNCRLRFCGKTH